MKIGAAVSVVASFAYKKRCIARSLSLAMHLNFLTYNDAIFYR